VHVQFSTTYGNAPTSGGKNEPCARARAAVRARGQISLVHVTAIVHQGWSVKGVVGAVSLHRPPIGRLHSRRGDAPECAGMRGQVTTISRGDFTKTRAARDEQGAFIDLGENPGRCVLFFMNLRCRPRPFIPPRHLYPRLHSAISSMRRRRRVQRNSLIAMIDFNRSLTS